MKVGRTIAVSYINNDPASRKNSGDFLYRAVILKTTLLEGGDYGEILVEITPAADNPRRQKKEKRRFSLKDGRSCDGLLPADLA